MRKSFKDSLKVLEADIQHANTLASDFRREYDGACLQVYVDGTTTMSTQERKASIREFYGIIYPSLMQLQNGVTTLEDRKQKICVERYTKGEDDNESQCPDLDVELEEECDICMEVKDKLVLPKCSHAMCSTCYGDWRSRSLSCPFCRVSLERIDPCELWVYVDKKEVIDMAIITWENLNRFFMYIEKLPLVAPGSLFPFSCEVGKKAVRWESIKATKIQVHFSVLVFMNLSLQHRRYLQETCNSFHLMRSVVVSQVFPLRGNWLHGGRHRFAHLKVRVFVASS